MKKNWFWIAAAIVVVSALLVMNVSSCNSSRRHLKSLIAAELAVKQYEAKEIEYRNTIKELSNQKAALAKKADEQEDQIREIEKDRVVLKGRVAMANIRLIEAKTVEEKLIECMKANDEKDALLAVDELEIISLKALVETKDQSLLNADAIIKEVGGRLDECNATLQQYREANKPKGMTKLERAATAAVVTMAIAVAVRVLVVDRR